MACDWWRGWHVIGGGMVYGIDGEGVFNGKRQYVITREAALGM